MGARFPSISQRLTGRHWGVEEYCCPGNLSDQYAVDAAHDARAAVRYLRKMAPGPNWRRAWLWAVLPFS